MLRGKQQTGSSSACWASSQEQAPFLYSVSTYEACSHICLLLWGGKPAPKASGWMVRVWVSGPDLLRDLVPVTRGSDTQRPQQQWESSERSGGLGRPWLRVGVWQEGTGSPVLAETQWHTEGVESEAAVQPRPTAQAVWPWTYFFTTARGGGSTYKTAAWRKRP